MRPRRREPERPFAQIAGPAVDQHRSQHSAESQPTDLVRPSSDAAPHTDQTKRPRLWSGPLGQVPPSQQAADSSSATFDLRMANCDARRCGKRNGRSEDRPPCCSAHPNPKRPDAGEAGDQRGLEVRAELVAHKVKPRVHRGGDDDQIRPDRDQVSRAGEHVGDADHAAAAIKRKAGTISRSSAIEPKIVTVQQSR